MSLLSIFGIGKGGIKNALRNNAVIVDIRTAHEYDGGRVRESINIPEDRIRANIGRIREMNRPVVICCTSSARCAKAVSILKSAGIKQVFNGGSWENVLSLQKSL